jgi:hypothetical protein
MALPTLPDDPFYAAILRGIGAPVSDNTRMALYAWRQAEGGAATYNPFNTTKKLPGSTLYASNTHGVQNYLTPQQGVEATVATLSLGKYSGVVNALRGDKSPEEFAAAVIASPWGTKDLLTKVIAMFRRGRLVVASIPARAGAPSIASLTPPAVPAVLPETRPAKPPKRRRSALALWLAAGGITVLLGIAAFALLSRTPSRAPAMPSAAAFRTNRRRRRR